MIDRTNENALLTYSDAVRAKLKHCNIAIPPSSRCKKAQALHIIIAVESIRCRSAQLLPLLQNCNALKHELRQIDVVFINNSLLFCTQLEKSILPYTESLLHMKGCLYVAKLLRIGVFS